MKLIAMHCPYCGGTVRIDSNVKKTSVFCTYCGQQIYVDDEVIRSEHKEIKIDAARIRESDAKTQLELERYKLYRERIGNYRKRLKILTFIGIGLSVLVVILCIVMKTLSDNYVLDSFDTFGVRTIGFLVLVIYWNIILGPVRDSKPMSPDEIELRKHEINAETEREIEHERAFWG